MEEKPYYLLHIFIVRINLNETIGVKGSNVAAALQKVLNNC